MAGTDSSRKAVTGGPAVVLVNPQLGENIGTSARAMFNCGLTDLRLVEPRDGWPSEKAQRAASGADPVLEAARVYPSIGEAVAELRHVYATTARDRGMVKRILTPREAALEMRQRIAEGEPCGVLFGPERMGLLTDDVSLADTIIAVPLNPRFSSLNLAQAVLIVGYEWYQSGDSTPPAELPMGKTAPATKKELYAFFEHLEEALDASGFLRNVEARPSMVRNLRNMFERAELTEQEIRTLHGVLTSFVGPRQRPTKSPPPSPAKGEGAKIRR
jgi:tRNA/rRNA methyltransferase